MHFWFHPPISLNVDRRISPMVPQKMIALRWLRAIMVTSKKYRKL
jgi:hypothetical protein